MSLLHHLTFERQKPIYRLCANFSTAPEVGMPSARYVNASTRSRYTDGTVYQRQPPEVGIQTLFSNSYWHRNARDIEIQTRQHLKNNFSMKHSEFLWKNCAFEHLAANVRVRCSDFSKLPVYAVYSNRHRHLCLASIAKFCDGGHWGIRWRDYGDD